MAQHLKRRGGRWYFQLAVPSDLQPLLGRKVVQEALGTADLREARAKRDELLGDWRARFRRARERKPPSPAEIDTVARAELRRAYEAASRDYLKADAGIDLADLAELLQGELDGSGWQIGASGAKEPTPARAAAEEALHRIGAEATPETIEAMHQALVRAQLTALKSFSAGIEPPLPDKPISSARRRRRQGGGLAFKEAAARFVDDRMRDPKAAWSAQTRHQNEATFRLFGEFVGDAPLASIERRDVADFLDTIAGLHRHYGRRPGAAKLSLQELTERHPAGSGEGVSNKTLNRHLSALSGLFRWCRRRGHLSDGHLNPCAEQMRDAGDNPWLPFTTDELGALFEGLRFEVRPNRHTLATARPWIMAAALFSGMREGEICDLDAENVQERDDVAYFDVTRAKSQAGVRLIPVHSELVRLGFLEYAASIGQGPLFPGITPGSRGGGRAHTFAKRFPEFRRGRGVTRGRLAFHSVRKSFVRALELAGVDRDRAALVVGHERGFTFRVYNPEGVDVAALREVVEAVRYPGFDLGCLR